MSSAPNDNYLCIPRSYCIRSAYANLCTQERKTYLFQNLRLLPPKDYNRQCLKDNTLSYYIAHIFFYFSKCATALLGSLFTNYFSKVL